MPIYEYECTKCGKTTEAMQKFSDPPLRECSQCQGGLRKLISMSTFHLKGSGWYVTDYSGKKQNAVSSTSAESDAAAPAKEKTEQKDDSGVKAAPASE